jgi:uncharacterized YccA/Bax inhibitor family protein
MPVVGGADGEGDRMKRSYETPLILSVVWLAIVKIDLLLHDGTFIASIAGLFCLGVAILRVIRDIDS